jgi:hypothetical protein
MTLHLREQLKQARREVISFGVTDGPLRFDGNFMHANIGFLEHISCVDEAELTLPTKSYCRNAVISLDFHVLQKHKFS